MARILIVGGSLGGLFAANLLWRDGHDVQVLEKARGSMSGRGAGIVTHDALAAALQRAGVGSDVSLGVEVPGRVLLNSDGSTHTQIDMPQVLTSWSRLYALLRQALPDERYHGGVTVERVVDGEGVVALHGLTDNAQTTWEGELLVAADGIRSTVRQQLFPNVRQHYAGYVAWRGVCDEAVLSQRTLQTLFPYFGFGVLPREQIIGYPVAGADGLTDAGHRAYNFVWYRPAAEGAELIDLMSDADGQHHPLGLPPHKVSWKHMARMRQDAAERLAPQWAEVVQKTAQPFLQPIYDLVSDQLHQGRVVLMGDAAFVGRPHIGMGVTKAAEDAVALSDALRQHGATPEALRAYAAVRHPSGLAAVARARWLGAHLEAAPQDSEAADGSAVPAERLHQAVAETAIDLGRYGHRSGFPGVSAIAS